MVGMCRKVFKGLLYPCSFPSALWWSIITIMVATMLNQPNRTLLTTRAYWINSLNKSTYLSRRLISRNFCVFSDALQLLERVSNLQFNMTGLAHAAALTSPSLAQIMKYRIVLAAYYTAISNAVEIEPEIVKVVSPLISTEQEARWDCSSRISWHVQTSDWATCRQFGLILLSEVFL